MFSGRCGAASLRLTLLLLAFPLALKAQPIHVTGRALMDRTRGLSGARVEIFSAYEGYAEAVHRLAPGGAPAPVATGQTDSKGFFDLTVPASGCFRLVVRTAGDLPMEYLLLPLAETMEVPPVLLPPASPLEVRTVGGDGRPIAGAAVRVERPRWYGQDAFPRWQPADQDGVSGTDGKVAFLRNPEEPPEVISLTPRFLGQRAHVTGRETAVVLRLLPLPPERIEIQDAAGKPVAGALVRWQGLAVIVAGPDGRLEIAAPEGDPLDVESAAGRARLVPVPRPGIAVMPVRLEPPHRIAGKVLDAMSGAPVKGSVAWSGRPPVAPAALSGADGAFQLDVQPQEEIWVETAAPGFLPSERRFVPRGEAGPVLLKLTPSAAISGLAVDVADRPVAAAQIGIELRGPSSLAIRPVRTGSDGRFRLAGLLPDSRYDLSVTREGFARTSATARTPPAGGKSTPPVRIVIDGGVTASGLSASEDGQPLAGVELLVLGNMRRDAIRATSDEKGRFELRHLPLGRYDLLADYGLRPQPPGVHRHPNGRAGRRSRNGDDAGGYGHRGPGHGSSGAPDRGGGGPGEPGSDELPRHRAFGRRGSLEERCGQDRSGRRLPGRGSAAGHPLQCDRNPRRIRRRDCGGGQGAHPGAGADRAQGSPKPRLPSRRLRRGAGRGRPNRLAPGWPELRRGPLPGKGARADGRGRPAPGHGPSAGIADPPRGGRRLPVSPVARAADSRRPRSTGGEDRSRAARSPGRAGAERPGGAGGGSLRQRQAPGGAAPSARPFRALRFSRQNQR